MHHLNEISINPNYSDIGHVLSAILSSALIILSRSSRRHYFDYVVL
jgi:hypothetical protein